jgi:hypothetical protein
MTEKWHCPYSNCTQSSTRHWNLKIHIDRRHNGVGSPIRESQQYTPPNTTFARFNNYGRQNHKRLSILENRSTHLETTDDRHETMLKFLELQKLYNMAAQNWPSKQVFVPYLSTNPSHSDLASNLTLIWRAQTLELFRALKCLPPELLKKAITTAGHANLISIPIFEPYQDFYQLTNQGTESTIQLDVDDLSGHWLGRTIWLGMWKLERDQLLEFLRLTNGSAFGIFKITAANESHSCFMALIPSSWLPDSTFKDVQSAI